MGQGRPRATGVGVRWATNAITMPANSPYRDSLDGALRRSFVEGAGWPIERAALAALIDMGLSDERIAAYFAVDAAEVRALRGRYRLGA